MAQMQVQSPEVLRRELFCNTFSELAQKRAVVGQRVTLRGHTIPGIGGGQFLAKAGSVASDGGSVSPSAVEGIYWERVDYQYLTPQMFGVIEGMPDCTDLMQAAVNASTSLFTPAGLYLVRWADLTISKSNFLFFGEGEKTVFRLIDGSNIDKAGGVLQIFGSEGNFLTGIVVRDFKVDGNKNNVTVSIADARDCEVVNLKYCRNFEVSGVTAINGVHEGIDVDRCENGLIKNNKCHDNEGWGIHISTGSKGNRVESNRCFNNGFAKFRGGIDSYEGVEGLLPYSERNLYLSNECHDNYCNYGIRGHNNIAWGNLSYGATAVPDSVVGVEGGFNALGSGDYGPAIVFQSQGAAGVVAQLFEARNLDGNPRIRCSFNTVNDRLVFTDRFNNELFQIDPVGGYVGFNASMEPASGAFSSIIYNQRGGHAVKVGRSVSFDIRLNLSELMVGDASGDIRITGVPFVPIINSPVVVSSMINWGFGSVPVMLHGVIDTAGVIRLEIVDQNAAAQSFVGVSALKTGVGMSFANQIYLSGSFPVG